MLPLTLKPQPPDSKVSGISVIGVWLWHFVWTLSLSICPKHRGLYAEHTDMCTRFMQPMPATRAQSATSAQSFWGS